MAAVAFHHGARVFQSGENPVLVSLGDTSVVGLLCTAPDAVALDWPLDTPVLITNPSQAATLGDAGTAKDALDSIFDQAYTRVVLVRIDEGDDAADLLANAVGNFATLTGVHAFLKAESLGLPRPKLLLAPGIGTATTADGIASIAVTTPGAGYNQGTVAVTINHSAGAGAEAEAVVTAGAITAIVVTKPGFGYNATGLTVTISGGTSGAATASVGTTIGPVVAEAQGVAEKLRAIFYADGPDGTDVQAVQARAKINSRRVFYSDPRVLKSVEGSNVPKPSSPIFVGLQAKRDRERGPHWAGSNMEIAGIVGTNRGVLYGDQANYLNEHKVNTIINKNGLRSWGVWTCSSESVWQFVSVVRTHDAVNEAIENAFLEFVDRPMTRANLDFMVWSGVQALRNFENDGMLLPGSIFRLSNANSPTTGAQGIVKFAMAYEVPAPMVDIRVDAYRNIEIAYEALFNSVTGEFIVAE
ncbi:phage tail sheath protein [Tribonema minus]|uniref:Phage tail sheath protein n=1 Tax=Tribonema minus TaxID=303371 RepID=A0A836CF40_9STRA|nr:phage tail sheath protein [Tribonema minus]